MRTFFNNPARLHQLQTAARGWIGTPFVPHACIAGAGVDCVNLCAQIYQATGFLGAIQFPAYTMDGGKHNVRSQLIEFLEGRNDFVRVPAPITGDVRPGDLLCFTTGRSAHHTGIMLDLPLFIHSLFSRSVTLGNLRDRSFARRLTAVYRPVEPSPKTPDPKPQIPT